MTLTLDTCPVADELGLHIQRGGNLLEQRFAVLSSEHEASHRYSLVHVWSQIDPIVVWLMLNPSTADAFKSDPTVTRCQLFTRAWGYGGYIVLNLFGLRSTAPRALYEHPDPVGEHNDRYLLTYTAADITRGGPVVAAWGNHGALNDRALEVARLLAPTGVELLALEVNGTGQPRHPLYVAKTVTPSTFRPSLN
jgi:hypothetical protein